MKEIWKYLIIGCSVIVSVVILSFALTYRTRSCDTISVTGLGETVFMSDLIVWEGVISVESNDKLEGYKQIENNQKKVNEYLVANGIKSDEVKWGFVNSEKEYYSAYNDEGNYIGSRFSNYLITQTFIVTSKDVDNVERISRESSTLIAKNIDIDSRSPRYYYTQLDDLKLDLIENASKDAYMRAKNIVNNAGARMGKASSAHLGVFQITDPTGTEEYSYGGTFNTSSKEKKARITVRMEYRLK